MESEQGGRLNGYPRHASRGAGAAPRAAVSHLERWASLTYRN